MKDKIKILFIKPYADTIIYTKDIPLGILYLSSYLKIHQKDKVKIRFLNLQIEKSRSELLDLELSSFKPDIVGISLLAFEESFLSECVPLIKKYTPGAKIIIGGPYATTNYEDALKSYPIDYVVIGEGERVLHNIVKCCLSGDDIRELKGVAYRDGESVQVNEREPYIEDLDSIPFPDHDLITIDNYWGYHLQMNLILADKRYVPIISSRACPYGCVYCHNIFGKKLRKRSPENFVDEISMLYHEYGAREFHIVDDIFNIDRERMHRILNLIIESNMKIKIAFPNAMRGDLLNEEDIRLLKRAGAYMITLAVETGSERMQKVIKKNLDIKKVLENISIASRLGLLTKAYFMLGFPGETVEELEKTVSVAVRSDLDMAAFFVVTPFKGTELYRMAEQVYPNIGKDGFGSYYEKSFYESATGYNIRKLQKRAYMKFYSARRLVTLFLKSPLKSYFLFRFAAAVRNTLRI